MSDRTSFYPELARKIAPANGKLAVLLPGLGAVSTTLIAGVHLIRKGLAQPIGSVTQMQKLRLGKRSQPRFTLIKDLVPLAELDDLVFGGWDIFPDNAYEAAVKAGVLSKDMLSAVRPELESVKPWPAVFERTWVKNLDGPNVKTGRDEDAPRRGADRRHRGLPRSRAAHRGRSWSGAARPRSTRSRSRSTRRWRRSRRASRRIRRTSRPR